MKKSTIVRLVVLVVLVMGIVWLATAPIREAKERADYQASIKTVQGVIRSYGYYQTWFTTRWLGYIQNYSEVKIAKEDGQIVTLPLNKKVRSLGWYDSLPEGAEMFVISEESPWVYIDGTSEDDIYSITYAGTGKIKDLLKIEQIQSKIELARNFYFEEKFPDINEKWIGDTIFDLDPDQDGKFEMTMKTISHPKGYAIGEAYYDLTGEKPVLKMVVFSLWADYLPGSCKVFLKENGEWKIGFTNYRGIQTEYNKEKDRYEFDVKMTPIKHHKEWWDRMEKQSSKK